jgi:exodeoxyribonuclease VII small subunit
MAKTTKTDKADHPSFEKALTELEQIVDKLEKGGLSLNDSLGFFEKGVKLARFLRDELDRAEKKVEILLKDDKGGLKRAPFSVDEETPEDEGSPDEDDDEGENKDAGPSDKKGGKLPF